MSKHQDMLNELLEVEAGLTGWEMDFIDSLVGQGLNSQHDDFTEKQSDKIEQIWNRVFR